MESAEQEFKVLVEKRQQELQLQIDKKINRVKRWYRLIELILAFIGYGLIIYNSSFLLALGIWFAIWSNNMGFIRGTSKEGHLLKELWK